MFNRSRVDLIVSIYSLFDISLLSITSLLYLDPPSPPLVTLSQTDISCSNTLISWSTPSSDRSITSYSVYRDGVSIYNGPNTINQFTDNTQLNINTVYEYSVVAISCAGTSTAGVKSISIESEYLILSLMFNQYFNNSSSSFLTCCYYLTT